MIKIFNPTDKDFSTAGNIIINPIKCIETRKKSLNGWYLDVEVPIKYKEYIEQDMLCVVKTKSKVNLQAFRIKNIEYTSRKIIFKAQHVMFDAEDYFLLDARPENKNGQNTLSYLNERTDKTSPFTVYSNVTTTTTAYFIRKSLLEAWSTIEERWGGVFDADNWNISFYSQMGNDNGETIIYGQNLENIKVYEDWSKVCTKLCPVGYDGITLPEKYLESDIQYEEPYTRTIKFETQLENEKLTETNLIIELRTNAQKYLEEHQHPKISYEVSANVNEKLEMCDKVHIKHPLCNILTEVLEYEYNTISGKTKTIVFGNYSRDVKTKFDTIKTSLNQVNEKLTKQEIAINQQTSIINSLNKNGYVYIDENEILILDALPKEKAKNVWRFGLGGIGFSSNGYEGPFETAITMDGQINAKFITTGTMSVARIEGLENTLSNIKVALEINSNNVTSIIENMDEQNLKINKVQQSLDELRSQISEVADTTTSADGYGSVTLANINESEPIRVVIRPRGEDIAYLYPRNNLYPSNNLYLKNRKLRFKNANGYVFDWELPADLLYFDAEHYDELILDYEGQGCVINKKVAYNADGSKYLLTTPKTVSYVYPKIPLEEGDYTVTVLGYSNAYLFVRLMAQNIYTTQFATKTEVNSEISQKADEIDLSVDKKLSNYTTTVDMKALLQLKENSIISSVSETYSTKEETATAKSEAISSANNNTANKLKDYSTTVQMNSAIEQKANSIVNSVSATYATKTDLGNVSKNLTAKLELKINTEDLVSELNASADLITFKGNRFVIDSTYFKITKEGNITATGGTIGGFNLSTTEFSSTLNGPYNYNVYDARLCLSISVGNIQPTSLFYNLYDIDNNNKILATDALAILKHANGTIPLTRNISGSIKINSKDPKNCISITKGGSLVVSIGVGGINANVVTTENIICGYGLQNTTTSFTGIVLDGRAGKLCCVSGGITGTTITSSEVSSSSFNNTSLAELKKNIKELTSALEIIKNSKIYEFNYKTEKDEEKKHAGFVIGENYKTPQEVIGKSGNGIDLYNMCSIMWKAMQEIIEKIERV